MSCSLVWRPRWQVTPTSHQAPATSPFSAPPGPALLSPWKCHCVRSQAPTHQDTGAGRGCQRPAPPYLLLHAHLCPCFLGGRAAAGLGLRQGRPWNCFLSRHLGWLPSGPRSQRRGQAWPLAHSVAPASLSGSPEAGRPPPPAPSLSSPERACLPLQTWALPDACSLWHFRRS